MGLAGRNWIPKSSVASFRNAPILTPPRRLGWPCCLRCRTQPERVAINCKGHAGRALCADEDDDVTGFEYERDIAGPGIPCLVSKVFVRR